MALPPKVQQQLDQAEAVLQHINAPAPANEDVEPSADAAQAEPVTQPEPQPKPPETQQRTPDPQLEEVVQKYRTLQGIHRSKEEQIRQLEAEKAQLARQLEAAQKPQEKPADPLDPKDTEVFGEDLVDMVRRVTETLLGSVARRFDERLAALEQRLQGTSETVAKTAEEIFYDRLRELVPDYAELNVDEGFLSWLGEEDPVYGVPRQAALTNAANALDVKRVANVFKAYKATIAPAPAPAPRAQTSPLDKQIAPSSGAAAPTKASGKQVYTVAQVQRFYRDLQSGAYQGREAEAAQLEALFNDALAEGRIVDRIPRAA